MNQFLLKLSATQQIGAMFVLVFGALLLASIAALLLSLRDRGDDAAADAWRRELSRIDGVLRTSWVMVFVFWVGWLSGDAVTLVLIKLSAKEFALLEYLGRSSGKVVSAQELIKLTHGLNTDYVEAGTLLRPLIRTLRRKMGYHVGEMGCIENVRGVGYRLVADPA